MSSSIVSYDFVLSKRYDPIFNLWVLSLYYVEKLANGPDSKELIGARFSKKDHGWVYKRKIKKLKSLANNYCINKHLVDYDFHDFAVTIEVIL